MAGHSETSAFRHDVSLDLASIGRDYASMPTFLTVVAVLVALYFAVRCMARFYFPPDV